MPGQARGLVADALHQVAVGRDDPGAVVHQALAVARRHHALGERHADRGGQALAERSRGGLDRRVLAVLGMPGGGAVELAEAFQHVHFHAGVPGEVQQRIEQHGAVPGRQHEAVAVRPTRIDGVEAQQLGPQRSGNVRHAHRHTRMTGAGRLHRIDRQGADRVRHPALNGGGPGQNVRLGPKGGVVLSRPVPGQVFSRARAFHQSSASRTAQVLQGRSLYGRRSERASPVECKGFERTFHWPQTCCDRFAAPGRRTIIQRGASTRFARATTASNSTWQPASASSGSMLSASLWLSPSLHGVKIIAVGTCRAT